MGFDRISFSPLSSVWYLLKWRHHVPGGGITSTCSGAREIVHQQLSHSHKITNLLGVSPAMYQPARSKIHLIIVYIHIYIYIYIYIVASPLTEPFHSSTTPLYRSLYLGPNMVGQIHVNLEMALQRKSGFETDTATLFTV